MAVSHLDATLSSEDQTPRVWTQLTSGLELVRVTDLAPYHEGRLQLLEQRSGLDLRA